MLSWSLLFLLIAVVSGVLGFTVFVETSAAVAKFFFLFFLSLFVVGALSRAVQGKTP